MKTTGGSFGETGQDELDTLLASAPRYAPSAGFAERVLAALHEEEKPLATPRPWYLRPYSWGSAAAACIAAVLALHPLFSDTRPIAADSLAVDDALLVDEALDAIADPDLVNAICSVSSLAALDR